MIRNKYIKLVISILIILVGIFLIFNRNVGWGIVCIFLSIIPIFLFFRNEYIWLAFFKMRNQDLAKSAQWLAYIKDYKKQLHRSQFGYYHYMMGLSYSENPLKAEFYMKKALEYGLSMKHDRALAKFNLAIVAFSKGNRTEAQRLFNEAKKMDTAGLLKEQLNTMKNQFKMPNIQKHMHNPNMRSRR